jgi:hypothetical protein
MVNKINNFPIKTLAVTFGLLTLTVLTFTVLTGCALKARTIDELPKTFLEDVNLSYKRDNLPFQHSWVNPQANARDYTSVYFKKVRTDLLPRDAWLNSASVFVRNEAEYFDKAREIADYFHSQLIEKVGDPSRNPRKLTVTNYPSASTLIVEIALTELELSHPAARAGSLAAPIPGTGAAIAAVTDPHVAFAARITDARSGQLIATAADRNFAPARVLDINKLTVSSSAREISELWADSIAAALQSGGLAQVSEKKFDIMPF